jgi:hypothetical protein
MGGRQKRRLPRARGNCKHFEGRLAGCSRGGIGAISAAHVTLINGASRVVCSVNLDSCLKAAEQGSPRWDYVLVLDSGDGLGIGLEVHHADATEIPRMISKKEWASELIRRECDALVIVAWHWIVPRGKQPFFTPNDPRSRVLNQAGILFPTSLLQL